jgi:nucleoid-associated protein YgaU
MQAEEQGQYPGQNPTSGAREGYAVHVVKEGETIDWIAFTAYGTSTAWRHLAAGNDLDDPGRLQPGQRLLIVPLQS